MHFMPHKMREFITDRANISCSGCANLNHANLRLSKNEYHVNLTISKVFTSLLQVVSVSLFV